MGSFVFRGSAEHSCGELSYCRRLGLLSFESLTIHPSPPFLPLLPSTQKEQADSQNHRWNLSSPSSLLPMPHFPHLYPCPPTSLLLPPPTSERLRNVPPYACKWGCYKWWLGLMPMKGWCLAQSPAPLPPLPSLQISLGEPSSRWQPPTVRTRSFVTCLWM